MLAIEITRLRNKKMLWKNWPALLTATALLLTAFPAHAYLDPGTGSMIVQLVIGAIAVAGVTLKMYWQKILNLFRRRPDEEKGAED
jgi:hypothetical protein